VSHLRFTPPEYETISRVCERLGPDGHQLRKLQRLLVASLASSSPALAERIAHLQPRHLSLLHYHFWGRPEPTRELHFTVEEIKVLADACGKLVFNARFAQSVRRALVPMLREASPFLAAKIQRLSQEELEALCALVKKQRDHR
jgi:hypothetical protein